MTKEIRVRAGTFGKGTPRERRSAWIETVIPLQLEAHELAAGLGSKFLRNEPELDTSERPDVLPESMTQREIAKIYRDELIYWGTNLDTWSDDMAFEDQKVYSEWLMEIVLDAFPDMKGYEVR